MLRIENDNFGYYNKIKVVIGEIITIYENKDRDPLLDFFLFHKWLYTKAHNENINFIPCSSSYDHFFFDNPQYVEKYINEDIDGQWKFVNYQTDVKVVSHKDFKTFEELRKYCKERL